MELDADRCYRALQTHDVRFDGRFFVGVSSTGIYCRPVCAGKPPKRENCTFYPSAAAAEANGYRPCLRCRPELAPGNASVDAGSRLALAVAGHMEDGIADGERLEAIAHRLGVTDRHVRRVFQQEFGVAPIQFAQTQRLLLAKRLLTDTRMPITDVALSSGFQSVRRFNAAFRSHYRLSPTDLRRVVRSENPADRFVFELAFRPPYDWERLIAFLGARAIEGVEAVDARSYRRTVRVGEVTGWLRVQHNKRKNTIQVSISSALARALPQIISRVKRVFDLSCSPAEIAKALGDIARGYEGVRLPGAFDPFEMTVRAILGQQITVRAARTLAQRFAQKFGTAIETPFADLRCVFPSAETISVLKYGDIAGLGIIATRAKTIVALAERLASGELTLAPGSDVDATMMQLRSIPGIGEWTAQYIAMRALAWPDAFPHTDYGVMKALNEKAPKRVLALSEVWRPFRAYAVMHLWRSLEN